MQLRLLTILVLVRHEPERLRSVGRRPGDRRLISRWQHKGPAGRALIDGVLLWAAGKRSQRPRGAPRYKSHGDERGNDRQQMRIGRMREAALSDNWSKEYTRRTEALADAIAAHNIPFLWVGMPPFKSSKTQTDILALNDMYRAAAESAGGEFIDVWDGFVDEGGAFVTTGPDISGQPVRLRMADGINFTAAGNRKLAHFVEKELRRDLNQAKSNRNVPLLGAEAEQAKINPDNAVKTPAPSSPVARRADGEVLRRPSRYVVPAARSSRGTFRSQLAHIRDRLAPCAAAVSQSPSPLPFRST